MKYLLTLCIFTGFYKLSEGQVKMGVKAGYNLSTLLYTGVLTLQNQKDQSGFNGGIFASIPLSPYFSLQPEIVYSTQGTNYQVEAQNAAYHYNYLNFPLLIKYHHPVGLFAETGLQIGFPVTAKNVINGESVNILNKTYSPDYAWVIGLGYQIPEINLGIDIRYNLGLINIAHQEAGDINIKNSIFQFGLFYCFKL